MEVILFSNPGMPPHAPSGYETMVITAFERYSLINLPWKPPLAQVCNSVDCGNVNCTWNLDYLHFFVNILEDDRSTLVYHL